MRFDGRMIPVYCLPMSRYEYLPRYWPNHMSFAVGWDPALDTYYAQVMDYSISRDDGCVIAWLGAMPPHYTDIDALMLSLNKSILGRVHPVTLTAIMRAQLIRDQMPAEEIPPPRRRRGPLCALDLGNRRLARSQADNEDR
jgi:hypothetical protein